MAGLNDERLPPAGDVGGLDRRRGTADVGVNFAPEDNVAIGAAGGNVGLIEDAHSGKYALSLTPTRTDTHVFTTTIPAKAGDSFRLSAWAKRGTVRLAFYEYAKGKWLRTTPGGPAVNSSRASSIRRASGNRPSGSRWQARSNPSTLLVVNQNVGLAKSGEVLHFNGQTGAFVNKIPRLIKAGALWLLASMVVAFAVQNEMDISRPVLVIAWITVTAFAGYLSAATAAIPNARLSIGRAAMNSPTLLTTLIARFIFESPSC